MNTRNIAASVRTKLLNHARAAQQDFNLVLTRFCLERLLYRISISDHSGLFFLKGALLFDLWFDIPHRPTRDIDFMGIGSSDLTTIKSTFEEICNTKVDDGIEFKTETIRAEEIRKEANYSGVRVTMLATLDGARCQIQADIGFGDTITPQPDEVNYPVILEQFNAPKLKAYPRYTVVAEKFEALVKLGMVNSRMKDYFDLWVLTVHSEFNGETLSEAIKATFTRRKTKLPENLPIGLSTEFSDDAQKLLQWRAFLRKNKLEALPLNTIVSDLTKFLLPPTKAANSGDPFNYYWNSNKEWLKT